MYLEEELEAAIDTARKVINSRAISADRYIRGYNDCFAFFIEYEKALRGEDSLSKHITLSYSDSEEFLQQIKEQLGHSNLLKFALAMKFKPVKNRVPTLGDIAFDTDSGVGGCLIAAHNHWLSTTETNHGVRPKRRFYSKEIINVSLHVRPIKLGE